MPGIWIKYFSNGLTETGSDYNISCGNASWSQGCLDDITSVYITAGNNICRVFVPGTNWHQFDRFLCAGEKTTREYRAVQFLVVPGFVGRWIQISDLANQYIRIGFDLPSYCWAKNAILIEDDMVGSWVSVVVPEVGNPRIIAPTRKGSLKHDHKQISRQCP